MKRLILSVVPGIVALAYSALCAAPFEGFTEPFRKIEVAASESGTVEQLLVHEGDRITKGQALATLDNDVLEVTREIAAANVQARGKLDSALAELELRKTRLARLEPLRSEGHASQEEVDHARAELAVAMANVQTAGEQHRLDELDRKKIDAMIERRTIRSPIDGCVLKIQKEEREFVSASSAAVATIVQLDPLRVIFSLPTATAAKVEMGSSVALEFPENGTKAHGKVELVAPVTDAESGTARVKVLIDNPKGAYRCGVRCMLNMPQVIEMPSAPASSAGAVQK